MTSPLDLRPDLQPGVWARWQINEWMQIIQIEERVGPSLIVRVLSTGLPKVVPLIEYSSDDLTVIEEPPGASLMLEQARAGIMTIPRAALILQITEKAVRQRLRDGSLEGRKEGGSWVAVVLKPST